MEERTISLRVSGETYQRMRAIEHINWSAILRRALIEELEKVNQVKQEQRAKALAGIDNIRKSGIFNGGKSGAELIREWRDKRRF